jgi:branched-chain amino acid transport system substrate-binding protein
VAEKLWGGEVSWRTALAYDATRVLIAALEKNAHSNRTLLQKALSDPNFSTNGATGEIHFSPNGNGDRKEANVQLINVVRDN